MQTVVLFSVVLLIVTYKIIFLMAKRYKQKLKRIKKWRKIKEKNRICSQQLLYKSNEQDRKDILAGKETSNKGTLVIKGIFSENQINDFTEKFPVKKITIIKDDSAK